MSSLILPAGAFDDLPKIERECAQDIPFFASGDKLGRMIIRGKIDGIRVTVSDQIREPWDTLDGLRFPWQYRISVVEGLHRVVGIILRDAYEEILRAPSGKRTNSMVEVQAKYLFPALADFRRRGVEGFVTLWFDLNPHGAGIRVRADQEQVVKRPKRDRRAIREANFEEIDRYMNERKSIVVDGFGDAGELDARLN